MSDDDANKKLTLTFHLLPRTRNYPPRRLRDIKDGWTFFGRFILFFGVPVAVVVYLALARGFDLPLATLLASCFLLVFGVSLWSCVSCSLSVRVVPVLEGGYLDLARHDKNPATVKHPTALAFLTNDRKGRAIGKHYQQLVLFARQQNIPALSDFGEISVYDSASPYFEAEDGLCAISALVAYLKRHTDLIEDSQAVIQDLSNVEAVLAEAVAHRKRFCFAVM